MTSLLSRPTILFLFRAAIVWRQSGEAVIQMGRPFFSGKETEMKEKPLQPKSVFVYHYPTKILYTWPLILVGIVLFLLFLGAGNKISPDAKVVLGWIQKGMFWFILWTLLFDFKFRHSLVLIVVFVALVAIFALLIALDMDVYSAPLRFLKGCSPEYDAHGGFLDALFLLACWGMTHVWVHSFDYVEFKPSGEVVVNICGETRTVIVADNRSVETVFPDIAERMLCGAGTMYIKDMRNQKTYVLENSPWLARRLVQIEEQGLLLESGQKITPNAT
ncbi:MAG: hypothetical protein V1926_02250 [Candidatus Peregrinibacteria bacterium]